MKLGFVEPVLLRLRAVCMIVTAFVAIKPIGIADELAQLEHFERHVRPLLIERCGECHGDEKQEGGLRLDTRDGLLRGGDRGPAVVPGDASGSLLMEALSYDIEDLAMPPDGKLAENQIAAIAKWIDKGVSWQAESSNPTNEYDEASKISDHWAFQPVRPLVNQSIPKVQNRGWPKNAIDHFVLRNLEQRHLVPSDDASLATMTRRIYFDLVGLPPTWDRATDVARLIANEADDELTDESISLLVDRLLERSEYGERWGRHWLDVARYADAKGYVDGGQARYAFAYTYRDYVIRAFNEDKPYNEFVVEQLAADQLDFSTPTGDVAAPTADWRLAATGFLMVGRRFNHNFHDTLDDQIDVICRGLLGLTVTCARCHDHKFDPISTANYYSMYGILANSKEVSHALLPLLENADSTEKFNEYAAELKKRHDEYEQEYTELRDAIQHELRAYCGDYLVYIVQESARHRESSQNPLKTSRTMLRGPTAYGYGAFPLWREFLASRTESHPVFGIWRRMDAVDRNEFPVRLERLLSENAESFNCVLVEHLHNNPPKSMVQLARRYGNLLEETHAKWKEVEETAPSADSFDDPAWEELRQVLYGNESPAVMTRFDSIDCYHLDEHTEMRNLKGKIEEVSLERDDIPGRPMLLASRDDDIEPVVFLRGQPNRKGPPVPRRVPELLKSGRVDDGAEPEQTAGLLQEDRLQLARAIVDPHNPLTARVIVNRVWDWHFGQPLVATQSDFGLRSSPPSHPELLDYLTAWFVDNGWSLKKLHRLIMTSRTYRQKSVFRSNCAIADPENRWLWRFRPRRLEWEVIRDSLLAVSGNLETRGGGPPLQIGPADPDARCRTVYLNIDRQHISGFARNFDFPSPDFTAPRRESTTVPQQQLFFLNSPFVWKQAVTLGEWAAKLEEPSDAERFRHLYRRVLSQRPPSVEDVQRLLQSFRSTIDANAHAPKNSFGRSMLAESWAKVAHGLLQSNAFIFLE